MHITHPDARHGTEWMVHKPSFELHADGARYQHLNGCSEKKPHRGLRLGGCISSRLEVRPVSRLPGLYQLGQLRCTRSCRHELKTCPSFRCFAGKPSSQDVVLTLVWKGRVSDEKRVRHREYERLLGAKVVAHRTVGRTG